MKGIAVILTLVTCVGVPACGGEPLDDKRDASWVDKRVEAWQPTKAEHAFDEIGWARDIREAERLGKEHGRPVFLFTYDGASLSGYRC
jgi:hypothetical protein